MSWPRKTVPCRTISEQYARNARPLGCVCEPIRIGVPRALPVRDIPARSLAVSMADQSQGHGNGSRQVARSRSCRWRAELGPSARAYCAGSAPTLYSSQVQQQARIPAHYGEPLRTTERTLTWPYAGMHVHVPVSGGQGVAGSNPAVPTVFRTLLRHAQQQYSSTRGRLLRSAYGL